MVETYNGGTVHITASDDGINVAGGADGSASGNFRGGGGDMANNANNILTINGGYIVIDSGGDGLDSNGSVYMNGGTVIVNGPTNNGNGAIDYNGEFKVTAGYLVAVGSSGHGRGARRELHHLLHPGELQLGAAGGHAGAHRERGRRGDRHHGSQQAVPVDSGDVGGHRAGRHLQGLPGRLVHRDGRRTPSTPAATTPAVPNTRAWPSRAS